MRIDDIHVGGLYYWEHDGRGTGFPVKALDVRPERVNGEPGRKAVVEPVDRDGLPETREPYAGKTYVLPARELIPWREYWTPAAQDYVLRQEDAARAAVELDEAFEAADLHAARLTANGSVYVNLRLDPETARQLAALLGEAVGRPEVSEDATVR